MNKKRCGFTLVELIGAIVIITILCAMVMVVSGTARSRTLTTRVTADLEALNTGKSHWSLDHPQAAFPSDEPSRFLAIQKYSGPGAIGQHGELRGPQRPVLHQ